MCSGCLGAFYKQVTPNGVCYGSGGSKREISFRQNLFLRKRAGVRERDEEIDIRTEIEMRALDRLCPDYSFPKDLLANSAARRKLALIRQASRHVPFSLKS